jgi:hypothetical protein
VIERTEDSQLHSIEDALVRVFHGRVPDATIHAELEASRAHFRDARIRTFVPVLIHRETVDRLRRLPSARVPDQRTLPAISLPEPQLEPLQ